MHLPQCLVTANMHDNICLCTFEVADQSRRVFQIIHSVNLFTMNFIII